MLIRASDLTNKLSAKEVLLKFSKVYKIVRGKRESPSEIPPGVEKIEGLLGTNISLKGCGVKVEMLIFFLRIMHCISALQCIGDEVNDKYGNRCGKEEELFRC